MISRYTKLENLNYSYYYSNLSYRRHKAQRLKPEVEGKEGKIKIKKKKKREE